MAKKSSKSKKDAAAGGGTGPEWSDTREADPFRDVERFLEGVFEHGWKRLAALDRRLPRMDVIDRDAEVVVRAEVAGFARDELEVSVTDGAVTLKGEPRLESQAEEGEYCRAEIPHGAFARTVSLPAAIDADRAKARFDNGLLELTLPKLKQARRRRLDLG